MIELICAENAVGHQPTNELQNDLSRTIPCLSNFCWKLHVIRSMF